MTTPLRICITDDTAMHRSILKSTISSLARDPQRPIIADIVGEFDNGRALVEGIASHPCDLITLDIRMPELDGLSTLLLLKRAVRFGGKIVMVSSEQQENIDRFERGGNQQVKQMSDAQKLQNLGKIEERLLSGVAEPGKINTLLEGCEVLAMDPVSYAKHLGANGFVTKPYKPEEVHRVLSSLR